jgi:hypothetical protein
MKASPPAGYSPRSAPRRDGAPGYPPHTGQRPLVGRTHQLHAELLRQAPPDDDHIAQIVDFCLYLGAAPVVIRQLTPRADKRQRWGQPPPSDSSDTLLAGALSHAAPKLAPHTFDQRTTSGRSVEIMF